MITGFTSDAEGGSETPEQATFEVARPPREHVTSFVRQPFVELQPDAGGGEEPAGAGLRRALGELVTCTRCVGTWSAAGLASTQLVAPRSDVF